MRTYHGAGILFFVKHEQEVLILLGQRRRSGVWSIPGGGRHESDTDSWVTAQRETTEEFGSVPETHHIKFTLTYPFGIFGFRWSTFVIEVQDCLPISSYPDRQSRDFANEFRDAAWFPISALPPKIHWLLYPAIWRLRMRMRKWMRHARLS
jgi:8-oxo-dGTP pyrophosphatase MutT (NUDIX family)